MREIRIIEEKCRRCRLCLKSCGEAALSMGTDTVTVDSAACVLCGICVDACPFGAIELHQESAAAEQSHGIWVVCLTRNGALPKVSVELLGQGRRLADTRRTELTAILFGEETLAEEIVHYGADRVLWLEPEEKYREEACIQTLVREIRAELPEVLLFGATDEGRAIAPAVAAHLNTGLTADCTELTIDDTGLLHQTRPAFGGNLMAEIITPVRRPQMATVRPGVMTAAAADPSRTGRIQPLLGPEIRRQTEVLESVPEDSADDLDRDILLIAGRGIGGKKNLAEVFRLAEKMGASVGVTRPLVDTGICEHRYQVGQTGRTVAPKLLISLGVSGAIQHLAGIGGAETIVAVNSDPSAPIFSVARYKVQGDCMEMVRRLLKCCAE